jgi:hypothetical protein
MINKQTQTTETKKSISVVEVHYLELLFLTVFAFPNASRTGLDCVKQTDRLDSIRY